MAAPRTACFTSLLRLASATSTTYPRRCPRCLRTFSSVKGFRQSSKRQLMTESAYRPSTLDPGPPPPRNAAVPDTSIAGGSLSWSNGSSWLQQQGKGSQSETHPSHSIPEQEAQKPRPVLQETRASEQNAAAKPTRPTRTFRPRKAAISLTPSAVEHLRELLDSPEPKLIRVGVKNKGCSGSAYHLEYVDKPGKFDEQVEQDGVKVLIDSRALLKVIGSEMDWVEDKLSARFTFKNPNISKWLLSSMTSKCLTTSS